MNLMQVSAMRLFDFQVMIDAHVPLYFLLYTHSPPATINLNFEVLPPDAYPMNYFYDVPISVLLPLSEKIASIVQMEEETEEQIPEEDVAQSYEFDVEIIGATCDVVPDLMGKGIKRTRASHHL